MNELYRYLTLAVSNDWRRLDERQREDDKAEQMIKTGRELSLRKARPPRGRHRAHVYEQLDAGGFQLIEYGLRRRLLITDGEEAFGFAGHVDTRCADLSSGKLR